tara:strand:- start:154 stop:1008 length:855 start_codon:yes stop_codon:yes gene_type:complete
MANKSIKECFLNSPYKSIKHDSYFETYETLFSEFKGKNIVFVEVGVLNGGSLFMWKEYFGEKARIIGIDNNPDAKKWEKYNFEIFIGDQTDVEFWKKFHDKIDSIDILLDDGGHLDYQQSTTLFENIKFINNNGLIVIEDTHSSYMEEFGNPHKYSFMNMVFNLINKINYRSTHLNNKYNYLKLPVSDIHIFESIVSFRINKNKSKESKEVVNDGKDLNIKDYRYKNSNRQRIDSFFTKFKFLKKIPFLGKFINYIFINLIRDFIYNYLETKKKKKKMKKFFIF